MLFVRCMTLRIVIATMIRRSVAMAMAMVVIMCVRTSRSRVFMAAVVVCVLMDTATLNEAITFTHHHAHFSSAFTIIHRL
jgi:hypothetical protein